MRYVSRIFYYVIASLALSSCSSITLPNALVPNELIPSVVIDGQQFSCHEYGLLEFKIRQVIFNTPEDVVQAIDYVSRCKAGRLNASTSGTWQDADNAIRIIFDRQGEGIWMRNRRLPSGHPFTCHMLENLNASLSKGHGQQNEINDYLEAGPDSIYEEFEVCASDFESFNQDIISFYSANSQYQIKPLIEKYAGVPQELREWLISLKARVAIEREAAKTKADLSEQARIASLRLAKCQSSNAYEVYKKAEEVKASLRTLDYVKRSEDHQARIEQSSGVTDLTARRQLGELKIMAEDSLSKSEGEYRALGGTSTITIESTNNDPCTTGGK